MFINTNDCSLSENEFPQISDNDSLFQNVFFDDSNTKPSEPFIADLSSEFTSKQEPTLQSKKTRRSTSTLTEEELYEKKMKRMEKNRISAQRRRDRKKNELITLKELNKNLLLEIERLKQEIIEKDKIISMLKGNIDNSTDNSNIYIDTESTRTASPKRNFALCASAITLICLFVTLMHTSPMASNINNNFNSPRRLLALDNKTSTRTFEPPNHGNFSQRALEGKCLGNEAIKVSVKKESHRTDVVPISFFSNNNNKQSKINNNVISLYYNETFSSSIESNKQLANIVNIFQQLDKRFMLYNETKRKNANIRFEEDATKGECLYINLIVPVGNDLSYEFGCKVVELNKMIFN